MQGPAFTSFFFGKDKPGLAAFADLALLRLSLLYPFAVLISNSLTDAWDILLILFFLLGGQWRQKFQFIKSSPVLLVAALLVLVSFIGVFQSEDLSLVSLFKSLKYWRGHHPFPILIILAFVLTSQARRMFMLNSLGVAMTVTIIYSFCTYHYSPFGSLVPFREAAIARNTIWFGMALVVWCGLLICVPFSIRRNPYCRRFLSTNWRAAMRSVAQVSTGTYLRTFFEQSWRIHALQAIRYTLIAFCLVVIFGINPSRSAWVTVLAGITALLLTWNSRKGAVIAVILAVVCCWAGYHYSSSFARKTRSAGLEINDLLQTVFTENDSTENKPAHGRLQLYRHAVKHISGHPWGFGMLETQKKCREFSGDLLDNIHSEFLAFAMHSGWLGLAIFAALFYYLSKLSQQLAGPWKPLGLYVTATLLLACLFNGSFSQDMEGPLYCILIALLVAASLPSFTTRH